MRVKGAYDPRCSDKEALALNSTARLEVVLRLLFGLLGVADE